jgi:hypothetical protein
VAASGAKADAVRYAARRDELTMDWINDLDASITHFVSWASTINPWYRVLDVLVVLSLETSLLVGLLVPGEAALLLGAGVLVRGPMTEPSKASPDALP